MSILLDEMKGYYKLKPEKYFVHPYRGITRVGLKGGVIRAILCPKHENFLR